MAEDTDLLRNDPENLKYLAIRQALISLSDDFKSAKPDTDATNREIVDILDSLDQAFIKVSDLLRDDAEAFHKALIRLAEHIRAFSLNE
jgi:hypothetical protein